MTGQPYSGEAMQAAEACLSDHENAYAVALDALDAAHDPALGLVRSVCLRDVIEFIEREAANDAAWTPIARQKFGELLPHIKREFGGDR